jgi:O-antigen ligase
MTAVAAHDGLLQGWRQRYGGALFIGVFVLAAGLGFFATLGFAALGALAGLLALPLAWANRRALIGLALVAALVAWAAASMSWSRYAPDFGGDLYKTVEGLTGFKLAVEAILFSALCLAAARLPPRDAERALRVFAFGLTVLAAVLVVEGLSKAQIYLAMRRLLGEVFPPDLALRNVARGGYVLAVMVWPASMLLRREGRNPMVLALAAGVIVTSVLFGADAPGAALLAGLLALAAVLAFGRPAVLALGGLSAFYMLAAPWIVSLAIGQGLFARLKAALPASWDARLDIWSFADARILERPWLGWGLDASRTWKDIIPLHTHDAAMQVWLELGLPGAALVAALLFFLFWAASKATEGKGYMAVACATAVAYVTIGALSFGVWQDWWLALGAVALCACLALKRAIPLWGGDHPQEDSFDRPLRPL